MVNLWITVQWLKAKQEMIIEIKVTEVEGAGLSQNGESCDSKS